VQVLQQAWQLVKPVAGCCCYSTASLDLEEQPELSAMLL
jgi:16S rRNA C967 or C1407 C5-methylase (RsmB/RsmF family)